MSLLRRTAARPAPVRRRTPVSYERPERDNVPHIPAFWGPVRRPSRRQDF
ncbi:hypothetical protein ACFRI7_11815 [Streptomyces sp. NPDC056716]